GRRPHHVTGDPFGRRLDPRDLDHVGHLSGTGVVIRAVTHPHPGARPGSTGFTGPRAPVRRRAGPGRRSASAGPGPARPGAGRRRGSRRRPAAGGPPPRPPPRGRPRAPPPWPPSPAPP